MATMRKLTYDELLKLKAVVLYIVNKCEAIDYFHIFKIIYFADRDHYAKYGQRIINDTFCALKNGPVPSTLFDAIKIVVGQRNRAENSTLNIISDSLFSSDDTYSYILSAKETPDMDELSRSDIEYLDKAIVENLNIPFGVLSDKSHDEAWKEAWKNNQSSPINDISMAKAGGANSAMIEYIEENKLIDALIG